MEIERKNNGTRKVPTGIVPAWTIDVPSKKMLTKLLATFVNLAIRLKRNFDVSISGITAKNDLYQKKAADVNGKLKEKSSQNSYKS